MKLEKLTVQRGAFDEVDAAAFAQAVAPLGLEVVLTGDGPALRRRPPTLSEQAAAACSSPPGGVVYDDADGPVKVPFPTADALK